MIEVVIQKEDRSLTWLDVTDPKKKELSQLAKDHGLHPSFVQDCLDPEHLPKFEKIGSTNFLILRQFDESCDAGADEVQELTRKVAIFSGPNLIITVHRKPQKFITELKEGWKLKADTASSSAIIYDLMYGVANTFEQPLETSFNNLERIETGMVDAQSLDPNLVKSTYYLKRKAYVFKRIIRLTMDVFTKINFSPFENPSSQSQELREKMENLFFYSDQLLEDTNSLLNLHISLSSQRTNEVVRLLTVFSLFFLPLNFIASIYGMNFDYMPEIHHEYGYPAALGSMAVVAVAIYWWFHRKGWI
jgi:magnesium transporter